MKTTILLAALFVLGATSAMADEYVHGHFRSDGTYVQPHYRSSPNSNPYDNYSTQGNINPYTGDKGTVDPYSQPRGYGNPIQIQPIKPIQPIQPIRPIQPYSQYGR